MMQDQSSPDFIGAMAQWGWPAYFAGLSAQDLLVMDTTSLDAYVARYGTPGCRTATPDTAEAAMADGDGAVLLLCQQGERQLARRLRMRDPGRKIICCSYDLAAQSGGQPLPAPADVAVGLPAVVRFEAPPILVVSSPYSDAEHLLDHLARNRLVQAEELMSQPLVALALSREDFDLRRFMLHLFARHTVDGHLAMHVQTDTLLALLDAGLLKFADLADWLAETEALIIYFTRRDKVVQCLIGEALSCGGFRSAWAMDKTARAALPRQSSPTEAVISRLHRVVQEESRIETFLEDEVETFRSYTLEELVESPVRVLKSIEIFLGRKLPEATQIPDYGAAYQGLGGIADAAPEVRTAYMKQLGLSRNSAGSLVSLTDKLFEELGRRA